jgi:transposase
MTERHALTDAEYERMRPLLPCNAGKRGRPYGLDHRVTLDGILWVLQTGLARPPRPLWGLA